MERSWLVAWVDRYEAAWRTPGTAALSGLFAPDATYRTAPFERPHKGIEQIAELWEAEREGHDEVLTMEAEVVACEGDTGVVRVQVVYGERAAREYLDLWIIRLDAAGHCFAFEEWPFWPDDKPGGWAAGPAA